MPPKKNQDLNVRFPASRIKKIMRTDDEVGKVAQVTPFLISKAVELFCISLMNAASTEVRSAGDAKRLAPVHIKRTTQHLPQFDFLKDLVSTIPDPNPPAASVFPADYELNFVMQESSPKPKRAPRKRKTTTTQEGEAGDASDGMQSTETIEVESSAESIKRPKVEERVPSSPTRVASTSSIPIVLPVPNIPMPLFALPPMPAPPAIPLPQHQAQINNPSSPTRSSPKATSPSNNWLNTVMNPPASAPASAPAPVPAPAPAPVLPPVQPVAKPESKQQNEADDEYD